jgi:DNA modification methylase
MGNAPQTDPRAAIAQAFEVWYGELQQMFAGYHPATPELSKLVRNQDNPSSAIHRWYTLKESFSAELPQWAVNWMREKYQHQPHLVCDPFLGGGTTGVALGLSGLQVSGIEYNPFIRFVAETKAASTCMSIDGFADSIAHLSGLSIQKFGHSLPELTTFHNSQYSPPENIQYLLGVLAAIDELDVNGLTKQALRLGVASAVEDAVHLHKDGRALRYQRKTMTTPLERIVAERWRSMLQDVRDLRQDIPRRDTPLYSVFAGSAIATEKLKSTDGGDVSFGDNEFDTSIFSPPYVNSFDYSEVYKLELWLLGYIDSYENWLKLRRGTLRSHPAIVFPTSAYLRSDARTRHIAVKLDEMGNSACIPKEERLRVQRVLLGYFEDMYLVLKELWRILRPGSILTYVVANSRYYYLPVASDVILAEIARCIGFQPIDLVVLRKRNGRTRQKSFLRESAVFLKKP